MPVYQYIGIRSDRQTVKGIVDADNVRAARLKIREGNVFPTDVREARCADGDSKGKARWDGRHWGARIPPLAVASFTRQLGGLLKAGVPLTEALEVLIEETDRLPLRRLLADVREQVREGMPFSAALQRHTAFPPVYLHMVRAGEESGTLNDILLQLSNLLEAQLSLKQKALDAALYPILMIIVSGMTLFFLMSFVIPRITAVFTDFRQALPWPTVMLTNVSHYFASYWWLLGGGVVVAAVAIRRYITTASGRVQADRLALRLPVIGQLVRKTAIARLTGAVATMIGSGVHLLDALEIGKRVMNNLVLEEAIESARRDIREGESIAAPLRRSGEIPPLVTHMIAVGEKSGELEGMLAQVSLIYAREVERLIARATSLLEPVMILGMGLIVFFVVMAVLLPIFEMSQIAR
jgi:general secretion pathway protein F